MIVRQRRSTVGHAGRLFRMSQDVRGLRATGAMKAPLPKTPALELHCGDRPGDLRVKLERRPRGRMELASRRVRALVSRVKVV